MDGVWLFLCGVYQYRFVEIEKKLFYSFEVGEICKSTLWWGIILPPIHLT